MNLQKGLSINEFKIYLRTRQLNKKMISIDEVANFLSITRDKARYFLYKLNKKGLIKRLKNGIYFFYPDEVLFNVHRYLEDPIFLLKYLAKPYFASHYTALDLYGLAQRWMNTYYITTTKNVKPLKTDHYVIKPIITTKKYFFGYTQIEYGNEKIYVSDLERTIVDIINRPELSCGYEDVIKSILDIEELNFSKLLEYLIRFEKRILFHRIGYLFETGIFRAYLNVPQDFLKKVKNQIHSINYFDNTNKSGTFNKKWKVIVPTELSNLLHYY